jgi:hypothetical protein
MGSTVLLSGTYISQSGVELKYAIEKRTIKTTASETFEFEDEDEKGNIYMVTFKDNAYSASIAKLSLNTWTVLEGKLFFITSKEYMQFLENVVDKDHIWTIKDSGNHLVELPGRWFR